MPNFPDLLVRRASADPTAVAYRFFHGSDAPLTLTYQQLWQQAASLAYTLQAQGLAHERVLLVCKSQMNFVLAFWACLLAGCVAVPTAVPRRQALLERLQLLATDAQVSAVIGDSDDVQHAALTRHGAQLQRFDMRVCLQAEGQAERAAMLAAPALDDASIALLQYTSGSTGDPKGVIISHGNLVANCAAIQDAMALGRTSSIFTALPLFHDMGLVGGVMTGVFIGAESNIMSPAEWVQYPERWLRIMSDYSIVVSGGPNYMYELAAHSITPAQMAGIDLSAWRVAFCGAEPVRAATIARFTRHVAPFGFSASAFHPCYGMAESTLFISGKTDVRARPITSNVHGNDVVSCGTARQDARIEIVDPVTCLRAPAGTVGEIWTSGSSVALGYWMRPELTERTFRARIVDAGAQPFLRTGDLGYIKDGELFVTSRLKDLIIVYGKKYAPQDLEDAADGSHAALRRAGIAAFAVNAGDSEKLVLVCELERVWLRRPADWNAVIGAVRGAVRAAHGVNVDEVVLISPGSLPRTSSGKVRRSQCSADYLAGALERASAPAASNASLSPA